MRSPSSSGTSGAMRSVPDLAPVWWTRTSGLPAKTPPALPSFSRNSAMTDRFMASKSMASGMVGSAGGGRRVFPPIGDTLLSARLASAHGGHHHAAGYLSHLLGALRCPRDRHRRQADEGDRRSGQPDVQGLHLRQGTGV